MSSSAPAPDQRPGGRLGLTAAVMAWIGVALLADAAPFPERAELLRQVVLGALTWLWLVLALRREPATVRAQTLLVVALATAVEYTFSPLLGAYTYRIGTVPPFVPPGHGLVYLAALSAGRSVLVQRHARLLVAGTVLAGGAWAVAGLLPGVLSDRTDHLGALWYLCLVAFLAWGRSRLLYVGAFLVVSWLELVGTALGTWTWAAVDPVWGVIGQGNPPSGAAGGYGWFDLWALLLAPHALRLWTAARQRLRRPSRLGVLPEELEDLVVQRAVGGQGVAAERAVLPGE